MTDPRGKEPCALSRRHRNHPLAAQTRLRIFIDPNSSARRAENLEPTPRPTVRI
jgi:hypothetical protein